MMLLSQACAKTVVETKIQYVRPEIPAVLLSQCDPIPANTSITTNGELLMSYISLQTAYLTCSSKVLSISTILKSYADIYETDKGDETDKSNENDNIE